VRNKVGITFSAFDLLHPGHLEFLRLCKLNCDRLVVGLQVDPSKERPETKEKPVETVLERLTRLQACKYVDEVIVYETERDLLNILHTRTDVTVRFLGTDYLDKDFTGKGIKEDWHIARDHDWSSSEYRARFKLNKPSEFCEHSGVLIPKVESPEFLKRER